MVDCYLFEEISFVFGFSFACHGGELHPVVLSSQCMSESPKELGKLQKSGPILGDFDSVCLIWGLDVDILKTSLPTEKQSKTSFAR